MVAAIGAFLAGGGRPSVDIRILRNYLHKVTGKAIPVKIEGESAAFVAIRGRRP
jgi:hypothetical protein